MIFHNGRDDSTADGDGYGISIGDGSGGAGSKFQFLISKIAWVDTGYTFANSGV
jgi:hypothetical protein